jgi:hypothetical protein
VRGMYKMLRRRARSMGRGTRYDLGKTVLLVVGLGLLLYGFLSAFMGRIPIEDFRPLERLSLEGGLLIGGGALLFGVREGFKRLLPEGAESFPQLFLKQALLYVGTAGFVYGFVTLFMGRWMRPHPVDNPWGFWMGVSFLSAGALQILVLRPFALRNELAGTVRQMVGTLADMEDDQRRAMMRQRMAVIAGQPLPERVAHVALMLEALGRLDDERRARMEDARTATMASLGSGERQRLMEAMDLAMSGGARAGANAAVRAGARAVRPPRLGST